MAPPSAAAGLLSPSELSFLHQSLSLTPPIRPDGRTPLEFRPLLAETDILPNTNGSARVCFADGTEAIVGVKAQVEKSALNTASQAVYSTHRHNHQEHESRKFEAPPPSEGLGESSWVELAIELPGYRDDDALPVFLAAMLSEALLSSGGLRSRLWINRRFHWKLYIDILLLSPPLSYPLPLLSMTTHLALLAARLPRLKSEKDEDPLFDDDWQASTYLYPLSEDGSRVDRPSITLVVAVIGNNFVFDPSKEELAAADAVLAISAGTSSKQHESAGKRLHLLSIRTIDTPARSTTAGVPNSLNTTIGDHTQVSAEQAAIIREAATTQAGVWNPPRGGIKRTLLSKIVAEALRSGGAADEVMEGLIAVQI